MSRSRNGTTEAAVKQTRSWLIGLGYFLLAGFVLFAAAFTWMMVAYGDYLSAKVARVFPDLFATIHDVSAGGC